VIIFTTRPLHPSKTEFQKEIKQKAGWVPEPVKMLRTRKKILLVLLIGTPFLGLLARG
jgi:hypothetical protein